MGGGGVSVSPKMGGRKGGVVFDEGMERASYTRSPAAPRITAQAQHKSTAAIPIRILGNDDDELLLASMKLSYLSRIILLDDK